MDSLSEELLLRIVEYVNTPEAWMRPAKHLGRVCRASRRLHRIGTPVMYKHIKQPSSGFHSLLETLWTNPRLRQHVVKLQDMHLDENRNKIDNDTRSSEIDQASAEVLITSVSEELGIDSMNVLARYKDGVDIWSALCALLAPNLEHLEVVLHQKSYTICNQPPLLLERMAQHTLGQPAGKVPMFNRLRCLHLKPRSRLRPIEEIDAFPLTLLPNLEVLVIGGWARPHQLHPHKLDDRLVFGKPWTWPIRTSPISDLSLCYTDLEVPVCDMIRACKQLVTFRCIVGGQNTGDWYKRVASALQEHRSTLQEINIGEGYDNVSEDAQSERFHSLELLPCLIQLRIPWRILLGRSAHAVLSEMLPSSLEELIIELHHLPEQDIEATFIGLHKYCITGRLAALKHIHLLWRLDNIPFRLAFDVVKVRDLFTSDGVHLDVTVFYRDMLRKSPLRSSALTCDTDAIEGPAPIILHRYKQIFPGYVTHEHKDLGRNGWNRPTHFLQASTQSRSPHEHGQLFGKPEW
jgi:hypothetical protein